MLLTILQISFLESTPVSSQADYDNFYIPWTDGRCLIQYFGIPNVEFVA